MRAKARRAEIIRNPCNKRTQEQLQLVLDDKRHGPVVRFKFNVLINLAVLEIHVLEHVEDSHETLVDGSVTTDEVGIKRPDQDLSSDVGVHDERANIRTQSSIHALLDLGSSTIDDEPMIANHSTRTDKDGVQLVEQQPHQGLDHTTARRRVPCFERAFECIELRRAVTQLTKDSIDTHGLHERDSDNHDWTS